jgi:hypothetical protein
MATAASLVDYGLPEDAGEDSYSILPALVGEPCEPPLRGEIVHNSIQGNFAIRQGEWVFIDSPSGDANREPDWLKEERGYVPHDHPGELFNVAEDRIEKNNLYAAHPDRVKSLKALLEKYKQEGRSDGRNPSPPGD